MSDKLTNEEFAAKCEWEGIEYAFTEYGLGADDLIDQSSELYFAARAVDSVKRQWEDAVARLEAALEDYES